MALTPRRARAPFLAAAALLGLALAPARAAERVVTLSPHLAELACAAGGCERLVGVVAWSDFPERVRALPQVGDAFAVSPERVLGLQPDLVLAWDGGTPRETIARLRGLGLRVEAVAIRRLDEVPEALRRIGAWLGTAADAAGAAQGYEARLRGLRQRHAGAARLRVMYQIETHPPYSVNRDSPISQVLDLCGGDNLFADLPTLAAPVEREVILARDPQVVLYAKQDDAAEIHAFWERLPPVAASRAGTLYAVDGSLLDRATPRLLDGVEQVCAALSDARARLRATGPPPSPAPAPAPAPPRTGSPTGG